jgi:phage-related baseplate assembly protein
MPKAIEFDVIIKGNGELVSNVTARLGEGADCREVKKVIQRVGTIVKEEQTGPFCDKVTERS